MEMIFMPLLLLASFQIPSEAVLSCDDVTKSCECVNKFKVLIITCPSKLGNEIKIQYTKRTTQISCSNPLYDVAALNLKFENLTDVVVQRCRSTNYFDQLSKAKVLKKLRFDNCSLDDEHVNTLHESIRHKGVEVMTLEGNKLKRIPEFLDYLIELGLPNNFIVELPDRMRFPNLQTLILNHNQIEILSENLFEGTPNLKLLDLRNNKIARLPPQLLHPLMNLTVLRLSFNSFRKVPKGFFEKNTELKHVILQSAYIDEIESNLFSNCTQLQILKLGNNSLRYLPRDLFKHISTLKYLDLTTNLFRNFSEDTFKGLPKLERLYLDDNKLTEWNGDFNKDLKSLVILSLKNNSLSEIGRDTFAGFQRLTELTLSHNSILEIDDLSFVDLKILGDLNLSHNKLAGMAYVFKMQFGRNSRKKNINLSSNNISNVNMLPEALKEPSQDYSGLKYICLAGNPINCDCESIGFLRLIKGRSDLVKLSCDVQCATPIKLNGTALSRANLEEFSCEDSKLYNCPERCACEIYPFTDSFKMNCSNIGLLQLPTVPRIEKASTKLEINLTEIEVNLAKNFIGEFTEVLGKSYKNVTVLNLTNNYLKKIDWISSKVKVLDLSNSKIGKVEKNVALSLNASESLRYLNLDNTTWDCNCELAYFVNFLRNALAAKINNTDTMLCSDGSPLMELHEDRACKPNTVLLLLFIIVSLVCVFAILSLIFFIYFQDYAKIWLYNSRLMPFIAGKRQTDDDKIYDIFLSYSYKDENFITNELVPHLEKYKLCIPERDWTVGDFIPKLINESVRDSRRTLLVLSRNFLKSDTGVMEFKAARAKSQRDHFNRLIVILYGDIDLAEVDDEKLKLYLKTNTYIKWGDEWFWKKLRRSLPSKKDGNFKADMKVDLAPS